MSWLIDAELKEKIFDGSMEFWKVIIGFVRSCKDFLMKAKVILDNQFLSKLCLGLIFFLNNFYHIKQQI